MATEMEALWREFEAATAAAAAHDRNGYIDFAGPAWVRFMASKAAIEAARPVDVPGLAVQVRYYRQLSTEGLDPNEDQEEMFAHVAAQLEVLARPGAVTLATDAAATIRAALVRAVEHHGGEEQPYEHEPGLPDDIRSFEAQMRVALGLLPSNGRAAA